MTRVSVEEETAPQASRSRSIWTVAWGTIVVFIVLAVVMAGLAFIGIRGGHQSAEVVKAPPAVFEAERGQIEVWAQRAAAAATEAAQVELRGALDEVFVPVHMAVPTYADFHYSVLGGYIELSEAATRSVSTSMEEYLFPGFDARLDAALDDVRDVYVSAFQAEVEGQMEAERLAFDEDAVIGEITRSVVADTVSRASIGIPADALAASAGAIGAKAAAKALSKGVMKNIAKIAAKGVGKSFGVGGAAAAGAAAGSAAGPLGTLVGGVLVGGAAWLGMEFAVVTIDEFFGRDEFEAELHGMIDEEQKALEERIAGLLAPGLVAEPGLSIREIRDLRRRQGE